ncbi:MAG: PKD domain-containing protein [Chitinophagaceae bacterium]
MNATNFFTKRMLGMDYRVWGAMLLVCFLSLGLYGYKQIRVNTTNDRPCPPDTITVNGKRVEVVAICYLNRYSLFEVQSEAAATVEWNFRDGTKVKNGRIVSHKFTQEGTYRITATVNGRCEFEFGLEIVEDPLHSGNQEKPIVEIYADPMSPATGSTVNFYCLADMASIASYEWKVLNTNEVQKDAVPAFTFNDAGTYTIQLVINNDPSTTTTRVIEVSTEMTQTQRTANSDLGAGMPGNIGPLGNLINGGGNSSNNNDPQSNNGSANNNQGTIKPPVDSSKIAPMPKAPEVDPNAFKDLLQNVVDENGKELEDLYEYLDYKASTMVEVNENKPLIPLKDFCKNMKDKKKKKRKIQSLSFKIDDKKSIQAIQVKVPESGGFWDRLNPFN